MAGVINQLTEVLQDQLECYMGLETLADYKKEAVIKKDLDFLNQVVEREEEFIGRVNLLEKKRESLLRDIALVTGLRYETITLTAILEKFESGTVVRENLLKLKEDLKEILARLKEKNKLNKELLDESLEFVNFTMNAIQTTTRVEVPSNYVKEGNSINIEPRSFFDTKQ